jgi:hypothetical protein
VAVVKKISKMGEMGETDLFPAATRRLGGVLQGCFQARRLVVAANEWRSFLEVQGHSHQMRNRASFEFAHDRGAVMLRGSGGNLQSSRDDLGGKALDQQIENFVLALRQQFAA